MNLGSTTAPGFRERAAHHFGFLEGLGFRRSPQDDTDSSVGASVAYAGAKLGLRVSLDVRDQCVGVRVTGLRSGRLDDDAPGGSSEDLLTRLVERHGYRGGGAVGGSERVRDAASLERVLGAWAGLLRREANLLLE